MGVLSVANLSHGFEAGPDKGLDGGEVLLDGVDENLSVLDFLFRAVFPLKGVSSVLSLMYSVAIGENVPEIGDALRNWD